MKILRIVGNNYSGSTLLAAMLNKHPKVFSGSEIYHIEQFLPQTKVEKPNAICSCMLESGKICNFWQDVVKKAGNSKEIYRILAEKTGKEIIVDSTKFGQNGDKSNDYGRYIDDDAGYYSRLSSHKKIFIHMFKSIEEYAASCLRYGLHSVEYIAKSWCMRNNIPNRNAITIAYEKFMNHRENYLIGLCEKLDIEYQKGLQDFWETDEHHLLAGNDGVLAFYHEPDINGKSTDALNMRPDHRRNFRKIFYDPYKWMKTVTPEIQKHLWEYNDVQLISQRLGLTRKER